MLYGGLRTDITPILQQQKIYQKNIDIFVFFTFRMPKLRLPPLALIAIAMLEGCSITPAQLRTDPQPSSHYTFIAPQDYQAAYRTILTQSKDCWQIGLISASIVVSGDLYHDTKTGTITSTMVDALGAKTMTVIDIQSTGPQTSNITISAQPQPLKSLGPTVKSWALDNASACQID